MLAIEVHDDVQRLTFSTWRSRSAGYQVSTYVVRGVMIDAAFDDAGPELMAWIGANHPAGVIVTHAHDDHGGNAERLARAGVPMLMARETEALLRAPRMRSLARRWTWGGMPLLKSAFRSFEPAGLEMVFTPGHSPDHHVVWDAERETLFAADLFLSVKVRVAHPAHREDVRQQVASVRKAVALKPRRVFDAHRGLLPDGVRALEAKANWIEETCGRIDALIDRGWSDRAIVKEVFGGESWYALTTGGDFSRANFVASVRQTHGRPPG
ncbi:MAG: MBL fold metallo-hydrolase [Gemmatimonadota bacterium]|nr:MBL fold metallo-hydrolase [Gemmatimonadota bacterium]